MSRTASPAHAAISVVLLGTLLTTPLKQVLAQASQQDAASVQQTTAQDSSRTAELIRVPPVTDRTARLLEPLASEDALADIFAKDGSLTERAPRDIPKAVKIPLYFIAIVAAIAAVLALLLVLLCGPKGSRCLTS